MDETILQIYYNSSHLFGLAVRTVEYRPFCFDRIVRGIIVGLIKTIHFYGNVIISEESKEVSGFDKEMLVSK